MKKLWQRLKDIGFVYIIGGFIISAMTAMLIVGLTAVFVQDTYKDDRNARLMILIPTCVAAFILFVFMMRRFLNKKFRMLKNYYIMASVISFTAAILVIEIMDKHLWVVLKNEVYHILGVAQNLTCVIYRTLQGHSHILTNIYNHLIAGVYGNFNQLIITKIVIQNLHKSVLIIWKIRT